MVPWVRGAMCGLLLLDAGVTMYASVVSASSAAASGMSIAANNMATICSVFIVSPDSDLNNSS